MNNHSDATKIDNIVQNTNTSSPVNQVVLGGIEGVRQRLNSDNVEVVIAALKEAVNYQDEGLDLVITALQERLLKKQESGENILTTEQYYQLVAENRNTQDFTGLVGLDLTQVEFGNKNLEFPRPNLSHAILSGLNLSKFSLNYAKLTNTNLDNVDLYAANLQKANLKNASLKNADLGKANCVNADFSFADLTGTNLSDTIPLLSVSEN